MNINYRYTSHQVPRGARPDAETQDAFFLIKGVSSLRLTYQIRLLAFRAYEKARKLVLRIPKHCKVHPTLRDLQKEYSKLVQIEKV
jgi:hypothetical protein